MHLPPNVATPAHPDRSLLRAALLVAVAALLPGTVAARPLAGPAAALPGAQAATATLAGTVVDSDLAAPLAGVRVELVGSGTSALTDAAGAFTFDAVAPGTYALAFTYDGYVRQVRDGVVVGSDAPGLVEVALEPAPLVDAPAEPWQLRLLDLAYGAASAMPLEPHVKNRSRAQERVVTAALELELWATAERYADGIANWRRGACYADLAYALLPTEHDGHVLRVMDRAVGIWKEMPVTEAQSWRRDRIGTKVARLMVAVGDVGAAKSFSEGADESELGRVFSELATRMEPEQLEAFVAETEEVVRVGVFEVVSAQLAIAAELHARFFEDPEARALLEATIRGSWDNLPVQLRLELMQTLCGNAVDQGDLEEARRLLDDTQELHAGFTWRFARYELPNLAALAALRHDAGQSDLAADLIDRGVARFDADEEQIVNIYRAGALRGLAEAAARLGDRDRALGLYARCLELGQVNPNSRPRADDLADTLASMARHGVAPTPALLGRAVELHDGLGDPW